MTDERYQKIMADLGMPNSRSLLQALQQVANEVAQEVQAAEREHVRIPASAAEAKAMATVSIAWMREHAPDELRPEFRA